jgi:hypothetical protein
VRVGGQQNPLAAPYAGPYQVVAAGAKNFTIQVGQRQEVISVDRLKAHTGVPARCLLQRLPPLGRPLKKSATSTIQPVPY